MRNAFPSRRVALLVAVVLAGAAGCRTAPSTPETESDSDQTAATETASADEASRSLERNVTLEADSPKPMRFAFAVDLPDWYESPDPRLEADDEKQDPTREDPLRLLDVGAPHGGVGQNCALTSFAHGYDYIGFCRGDGYFGPVRSSSAVGGVGLGPDDQVYVGLRDGRLLRRPKETDEFELIHEFSGSTFEHWDVAGDTVVAASSPRNIWISYDGGRTFDSSFLREDLLESVVARPDGLVVVRTRTYDGGDPKMHVTDNSGVSWTTVEGPSGEMDRRGSWVRTRVNGSYKVLARDGRTWVDAPSTDEFGFWDQIFELRHRVVSEKPARARTLDVPEMPRAEAETAGEGHGFGRIVSHCRGFPCLIGNQVHPNRDPSPTQYRVLGTLLCDAKEGTEGKDGSPEACRKSADRVAEPRGLAYDLENARIRTIDDLPAMCLDGAADTARLGSARGLAILRCPTGDGIGIWTATDDLEWTRETTVEADVELNLRVAARGATLVLEEVCSETEDSCDGWLRAPREPGAEEIWTHVSVDRGLSYRPVRGGRAVAFARTAPDADTFDVSLFDPSGERERVSRGVEMPVEGTVRVQVNAEGYLSGEAVEAKGQGKPSHPEDRKTSVRRNPLLLHTDGEWRRFPDAEAAQSER